MDFKQWHEVQHFYGFTPHTIHSSFFLPPYDWKKPINPNICLDADTGCHYFQLLSGWKWDEVEHKVRINQQILLEFMYHTGDDSRRCNSGQALTFITVKIGFCGKRPGHSSHVIDWEYAVLYQVFATLWWTLQRNADLAILNVFYRMRRTSAAWSFKRPIFG